VAPGDSLKIHPQFKNVIGRHLFRFLPQILKGQRRPPTGVAAKTAPKQSKFFETKKGFKPFVTRKN